MIYSNDTTMMVSKILEILPDADEIDLFKFIHWAINETNFVVDWTDKDSIENMAKLFTKEWPNWK